MPCFWCRSENVTLTDDHALPRSLGGTTQFLVRACSACQNLLSKVEDEVARGSVLALHALSSPLGPRHPERPTSGHLKPVHLLVKHPYGGYGETLFSARDRLSSLPYFEINVTAGENVVGKIHAAAADDAQRLFETFWRGLKSQPGPDGSIFSIKVDCKLDPSIAEDTDFRPRILLLPGDRLLLRARNPEEAVRYINAFGALVTPDYKIDRAKWDKATVIKGGTPHSLMLDYNPRVVRRIVAKIAYALFAIVSDRSLEGTWDQYLRKYILGQAPTEDEPVSEEPDQLTRTTNDEPHYVLLSPAHDRTAAVVCLYTFKFRVELGEGSELLSPIVVLCETDGSGMRIAGMHEAEAIVRNAGEISFLRS
jgi:hypothetical protein